MDGHQGKDGAGARTIRPRIKTWPAIGGFSTILRMNVRAIPRAQRMRKLPLLAPLRRDVFCFLS